MATFEYASVAGLVDGLRLGRYSSQDIVRHCLSRIARLDSHHSAFVETYDAQAIEAARASDDRRARGQPQHALDGIPYAVKDNFDVAGRPTSAGVRAWGHRAGNGTASAIRRLQEAGGILLGKTQLTELAYSGWGLNAGMPAPVNPWGLKGPARAAGGSSSGSAVAVAAGMVPIALGTDTGGSIRHPAAFCGLTGLRPSHGRIDSEGIVPLAPDFDTVGLLGHTATDLGLLDSVLHRAADAVANRPMTASIRNPRIGTLSPEAYPCAVDEDIVRAQVAVVAQLQSLGARMQRIALPVTYAEMAPVQAALTVGQAYRCHGGDIETRPHDFSAELLTWIRAGKEVDAATYEACQRRRVAHRARFEALWESCDMLLCPTVPFTAPLLAETDNRNTELFSFTRPAAYLGACAVSFPAGFCRRGLPIGMQLIAPSGADRILLAAVEAYQAATDWHTRRPPH